MEFRVRQFELILDDPPAVNRFPLNAVRRNADIMQQTRSHGADCPFRIRGEILLAGFQIHEVSGCAFRLRQQNHTHAADHRAHGGLPGFFGKPFAIEMIRISADAVVEFLARPDMVGEVMHEWNHIRCRNMVDQRFAEFVNQLVFTHHEFTLSQHGRSPVFLTESIHSAAAVADILADFAVRTVVIHAAQKRVDGEQLFQIVEMRIGDSGLTAAGINRLRNAVFLVTPDGRRERNPVIEEIIIFGFVGSDVERHHVIDEPVRNVRFGFPAFVGSFLLYRLLHRFHVTVHPARLVTARRQPALIGLVIEERVVAAPAELQVLHGRNKITAVVVVAPAFERRTRRCSLKHHGVPQTALDFHRTRHNFRGYGNFIAAADQNDVLLSWMICPVGIRLRMPRQTLFQPARPQQIVADILNRVEFALDTVVLPDFQSVVVSLFEHVTGKLCGNFPGQSQGGKFFRNPDRRHIPVHQIHAVKPELTFPRELESVHCAFARKLDVIGILFPDLEIPPDNVRAVRSQRRRNGQHIAAARNDMHGERTFRKTVFAVQHPESAVVHFFHRSPRIDI